MLFLCELSHPCCSSLPQAAFSGFLTLSTNVRSLIRSIFLRLVHPARNGNTGAVTQGPAAGRAAGSPVLAPFFPCGRGWGRASTGAYCTSSWPHPGRKERGKPQEQSPSALLITPFLYKEPEGGSEATQHK